MYSLLILAGGLGGLQSFSDARSSSAQGTLIKALHPERGETLDDWNVSVHSATDHGVVVADWGGEIGPAIRFLLKAGDPMWKGNSYRAELHMSDTRPAGGKRIYTREIYIPTDWDQGATSERWSAVIHQWHADSQAPASHSPVMGLRAFDGVSANFGHKNASGDWVRYTTIAIPVGRWITERVDVFWTTGDDGYVDLTLGDQRFRYDGPTLVGNYSVYEKVGVYNQGTKYYERNHQIWDYTGLPPSTPTATPARSPLPSPTPTASPKATATATPAVTSTPKATATPSATPAATSTPTTTATPSATPSATSTPKATVTPAPTSTPTATPTPIVVLSESYEGGIWRLDRQADWTRSDQRNIGSGEYAAEVDGSASDATMTSRSINLQGRKNAKISFSWYIESSADRGEYLAFDVSTDGGETWREKAKLRADIDAENAWVKVTDITLTNISELRLRFRGRMNASYEDANVDQVVVTAF